MVRTQIQLSDALYREAKRIAREREVSFAEVVRRGVEYIVRVYPPLDEGGKDWQPPRPRELGTFLAPVDDWRLIATEDSSAVDR